MGLDSLLATYRKNTDTPDTPAKITGYQVQATCLLTCTPDTPDTSQKTKAANDCDIQPKKEDEQLSGNTEQLKPPEADKIINRPKAADTWKPDPCNRCIHIARFTGGNVCLTDNGLALLYGFSHEVPDDQGATCASWQANREQARAQIARLKNGRHG
jgi:hypothetical protein